MSNGTNRKPLMATKAIEKPRGTKTKEIKFKYSDGTTEPNIYVEVNAENNFIVYDFIVRGSFLQLNGHDIGDTKRRDNKTLKIAKQERDRLKLEKEQIKSDRKRGIYTVVNPPRSISFYDFAIEYYKKKQKEADLKDKTVQDNLQRLVNHTSNKAARVLDGFSKGIPCGINEVFIANITAEMLDTLIYNSTALDSLSTRKKNTIIRQIKAIFRDAVSSCNLQHNPAEHLKLFKETRYERLKDDAKFTVSAEEVELLRYAILNRKGSSTLQNTMYSDSFYFLFKTGLRIGELLGLRFKDIDFNRNEINLTEQLQNSQIQPLKNNSSIRRIPLNSGCLQIIGEHREHFKKSKDFSDEWFIFGGDKLDKNRTYKILIPQKNIREKTRHYKTVHLNRPIYKNSISRALEWSYLYLEENDIQSFNYHITPHGFRHSYASTLISRGVSIAKVSKLLGHSNLWITIQTYLHAIPADDIHTLDILNEDKDKFQLIQIQ